MKTVADTLGVTRSNLVEQLRGSAKPRRRATAETVMPACMVSSTMASFCSAL